MENQTLEQIKISAFEVAEWFTRVYKEVAISHPDAESYANYLANLNCEWEFENRPEFYKKYSKEILQSTKDGAIKFYNEITVK